MRTFLTQPPYESADQGWNKRGIWPCSWISVDNAPTTPFAAVYYCRFHLQEPATIRVHVSADERYDLWLDSFRVGRGSERGDCHHWFYETFDWKLEAGSHVVAARVWS